MRKGKNFFYRINPNEVLGEVIFVENKESWFLQFFDDLRKDDPETAKIEMAAHIIREAHSFRAKRSLAGKASAEQKANKGEHMLNICSTKGQQTSTSSSSSSSSSSSTETVKKEKIKRFVPPSVPEVETYMAEIGYRGDAQKFIDHYTAKGWMVGKSKMKDWKAAVRTWRNNDKPKNEPVLVFTVSNKTFSAAELFDALWDHYPESNRYGRDEAFRCFQQSVLNDKDANDINRALKAYTNYVANKDPQFIHNGADWFGNHWRKHIPEGE